MLIGGGQAVPGDDSGLLPDSHSFVVTTDDGHTVELGPLVNAVLTTQRNTMRDAEFDRPMIPGLKVAAGFMAGAQYVVEVICGKAAAKPFQAHCDEMWRGST
jgi:hypothetical protein